MSRRAFAAVLTLAGLAVPAGGCSLILDFDEPVEGRDGGEVADGPDAPGQVDASVDPFEPNDTATQATVIEPGTYAGLSIAPSDDIDFFEFTLAAPSNVQIDVLFAQLNGDLDVYLYNDLSTVAIGSSTGYVDNEHIVKSPETSGPIGPGTFRIKVLSYEGRYSNQYTLVLTLY